MTPSLVGDVAGDPFQGPLYVDEQGNVVPAVDAEDVIARGDRTVKRLLDDKQTLCQQAMAALDTQLKAEIPLEYHAMYVMQRFFESKDRVKYERRDAAHATPTPLPWEEFEQEYASSAEKKERKAESEETGDMGK